LLLQTLYIVKELLGLLLLCAIFVYLWCTSAPEQPTQPDLIQRQGPTSGSSVTKPIVIAPGIAPVTSDGTLADRWAGAAPTRANGAPGQTPTSRFSTPSFQTNPFQTATPAPSAGPPTGHWATPSFQTNPFQSATPVPGGAPTGQWPTPGFQVNPFQSATPVPSGPPTGRWPTADDPSLANRWKDGPH